MGAKMDSMDLEREKGITIQVGACVVVMRYSCCYEIYILKYEI